MKIPSLSFTCEDIGVAMVTNMISQLQESFPFRRAVGSFEIKKSCLLCRNFISIYKIKRTLHGRLGIRVLSSSAESISHEWASLTWEIMNERYFQHSKIKFVSPSGHVLFCLFYLYWWNFKRTGCVRWRYDFLVKGKILVFHQYL